MGCNCKKTVVEKPQETKPEVINETIVPMTPEELLNQELKNWNGGPINIPENEQQ